MVCDVFYRSWSQSLFKLGQKQTFYATDQGGRTKVSKQEFDEKFQQWVESRIADLGLDLTTTGFIQGMMKTTILKGLGFNYMYIDTNYTNINVPGTTSNLQEHRIATTYTYKFYFT